VEFYATTLSVKFPLKFNPKTQHNAIRISKYEYDPYESTQKIPS